MKAKKKLVVQIQVNSFAKELEIMKNKLILRRGDYKKYIYK